jgi:hypothetical protein
MARDEDEADPGGQRISVHHLAETVQAGWNGAHDALDNAPAAHATVPSQTEQDVLARVGELQLSIRRETSARLNGLYAEVIGAREAFTTERYEARIRALDETMRGLLTKGGGALKQKVHDALRAKREYDFFCHVHQRPADPKLEKWQFTLLFLIVPLAIESLLNGTFFAEASEFGLVGGAATAVIISGLNIALGFILGLGPARYTQHVRASHLFWALPAYVAMIVVILLFNLAVGHYRELLLANPDATSVQVAPRMAANLLAIADLKSIALVIIGCIVAFIAAVKGYSAFGSYPGHAASFRRWRQRWREVEEEQQALDASLMPELMTIRTQIDGFRSECQAQIDKLQLSKASADQARDLDQTRLAQLRAARDGALMQYREANLKVRSAYPPAYFSQGMSMPELDHAGPPPEHALVRSAITDFERQLSNLPALIEAKLKDQLAMLRGVDWPGEVARVKAAAIKAGEDAFAQDEASRKALAGGLPAPSATSGLSA